jgi:energy-coupling factor transport system permease protein
VVCAADPDELLLACRRISPHSALTATLATRLIPVIGRDAQRLAEAQRCRPDGGARGARGKLAIIRATVGGALDRSLDVAAVLEMRGYGARGRVSRQRRALSRHDIAFAAAAAALLALSVFAAYTGAAPFSPYPLVSMPLSPSVFELAALMLALALAPFIDRRGIEP